MPRNGSGVYNLPQAPFTPGSTIASAAVNNNFSDIAATFTDSVAADGQTPMTGQLQGFAGSAATPGISFTGTPTNGFYAIVGGVGAAIGGVQVATLTSAGWSNAGLTGNAPIGSLMDFAGATAPAGWLLCGGQAVSRTTYTLLFSVISTTYGSGDGVTTFNVPDCRGRGTYGKDNMAGSAANRITIAGGNFDGTVLGGNGGLQNHTLSTGELPVHTHTITDPGHTHKVNGHSTATSAGGFTTTNFLGSGGTQIYDSATDGTQNTAMNASATTGITANNTGSGNAHTILSPAIIFNKIIFAGA